MVNNYVSANRMDKRGQFPAKSLFLRTQQAAKL